MIAWLGEVVMSPTLLTIALLAAVVLLGALLVEVYDGVRRRRRLVLRFGPALILAVWACMATVVLWAVTMVRPGP